MPKTKAAFWAVVALAFIVSACLPAGAAPAAKAAAAPKITVDSPPNTTVAIVNGEKITKEKVEQLVWQRYANSALTELIDRIAIRQAADKAGVKVETKDLDAKIADIKDKLPPGVTFEQFLQQYNMTPEQLRGELRTNVWIEKLAAQKVKVTDEDLAGYIKARHILISTKGNTPEERTKSEEENKKKLEEIAAEIKAGKVTFADAAEKNSDDPGSKEKGGDLGYIKQGQMVQEFEQAAFALKTGETSEAVKSVYGWHLIKVEGLGKDAKGAERQDLLDKVREERLRPMMTTVYLDIKSKAKVTRHMGEQPKPPAPPPSAQPAARPAPAPKAQPAKANTQPAGPPPPPADKPPAPPSPNK